MAPVRARALAPVLLATRGRRGVAALLIGFIVRERLVGDDREGVFHARQDLQLLGDEAADIGIFGEIALHQEIVLARGRIDFGDLLDNLDRFVGDDIGLAELAFDHDEDRLHASRSPLAVSRPRQPPANLTGRARKAGRWSPNPTTRRSSWSSRRL